MVIPNIGGLQKISRHFLLEEFFPRALVDAYGKDRLLTFIDPRILTIADFLRDTFGPLTVNDWLFGGQFQNCGFRAPREVTGAEFSQHRFGRAGDFHSRTVTAEEMRSEIRKNPDKFRAAGITAVEDGVSWLHTDCRWLPGQQGILFFHG